MDNEDPKRNSLKRKMTSVGGEREENGPSVQRASAAETSKRKREDESYQERPASRILDEEDTLQVEINSFIKNLSRVGEQIHAHKSTADAIFRHPTDLPQTRWVKENNVMIGILSNFTDILLSIPNCLDVCKYPSVLQPVLVALRKCFYLMSECMSTLGNVDVNTCQSFPDVTCVMGELSESVAMGHECVKACAKITKAAVEYIDMDKRVLAVQTLKRAFELCFTCLRLCKDTHGAKFFHQL